MKRKNFKVGDKVKLNGCPFDEQILEELQQYIELKDKVVTVTRVSKKTDLDAPWSGSDEQDPDGTYVKTSKTSDWINSGWFTKVSKKRKS